MRAAHSGLAVLLAALCLPALAENQHLEVPPGAGFDSVTIADASMLGKRVSHLAVARIQALFHASGCEKPAMTLYATPGRSRMVLASDCQHLIAPAYADQPERRDRDYGMIMIVDGDAVQRLANMDEFSFMYESGQLFAVTDLDHNGHLELWLGGTVYECGEEDGDGCDAEGENVVEEFDGLVRQFDHATWLAKPRGH